MATKIVTKEDCGNAPKSKYILDFLIAVVNRKVEKVLAMLTDDVRLEIVGRNTFSGKNEVKNVITKDGERSKVTQLEISHILSHGKRCAANGLMHFADGGKVAFNNIYTFSSHSKNAKLQLIETYSLILP